MDYSLGKLNRAFFDLFDEGFNQQDMYAYDYWEQLKYIFKAAGPRKQTVGIFFFRDNGYRLTELGSKYYEQLKRQYMLPDTHEPVDFRK